MSSYVVEYNKDKTSFSSFSKALKYAKSIGAEKIQQNLGAPYFGYNLSLYGKTVFTYDLNGEMTTTFKALLKKSKKVIDKIRGSVGI